MKKKINLLTMEIKYYLVINDNGIVIVSNQEPKNGDKVLTDNYLDWEFCDDIGTASATIPYWTNKNTCEVIIGSNYIPETKNILRNVHHNDGYLKTQQNYFSKDEIKKAMLFVWDKTLKYRHSDINIEKEINDFLMKKKLQVKIEIEDTRVLLLEILN